MGGMLKPPHNKIPSVSVVWAGSYDTAQTEQDNRVRIPNGTAAVCIEVFPLRKRATGVLSGKAGKTAGAISAHRYESEDLRITELSALRVLMGRRHVHRTNKKRLTFSGQPFFIAENAK